MALVACAAGCSPCLPFEQMQAADRAMQAQARAKTEPQMRAAAARYGAVLLPAVVQSIELPRCPSDPLAEAYGHPWLDPRKGCLDRNPKEGVYRIRVEGAKPRLLIDVAYGRDWELPYGRIAQRGNTFVLLDPIAHPRKARDGHACSCFIGSEGYSHEHNDYPILHVDGFVLDDVESPIVLERELVWIDVDVIEWRCDSTGI
jgi:hypothetical protein